MHPRRRPAGKPPPPALVAKKAGKRPENAVDEDTNTAAPTTEQARNKPVQSQALQSGAVRKALPAKELAELYKRKLTPAMRRSINQHLRPGNQAAQLRSSKHGVYVDLSDRASSVMIAIIDDNDNTVIADVTRPLPIN